MSTQTLTPPEARTQSSFSPEQRKWLDKLGQLVGDAAGAADDADAAATPAGKQTAAALVGAAFVPALVQWGPEVLKVIQQLGGGRRIAAIQVVNKTDRVIHRSEAKFKGGAFKKLPPLSIEPGGKGQFVAASPEPIPVIGVLKEGSIGSMDWLLDGDTTWTVEWSVPVLGSNGGDTKVDGINAFKFSADKVFTNERTAEYEFTLFGGDGPGPKPNPNPTPVSNVRSSCLVTINNKTNVDLSLAEDPGKESGDYRTFPDDTIPAGGSSSFVFEQTPDSKDEDCKGFLVYEVGSPAAGIWRLDWHNPKGEKNTASGKVDPQTAGFKTISKVGEGDENVPMVFTISGGSGGGDGPVPPPEPEPEFKPPVEQHQPTLRRGDKSVDGWVEYLQKLLNFHKAGNLQVDGDFGPATQTAVFKFQHDRHIQEDGTVGDQTWAELRDGAPEKVGTDGRKPHTFVEHGLEARWDREKTPGIYSKSADEMVLGCTSVGDEKIDDFLATVKVIPPGKKSKTKVVKVKIGAPIGKSSTGPGDHHGVKLPKFKKTFPALDDSGKVDPNADISDYKLEAYFDEELGGDLWQSPEIKVVD